MKMSAANIIPRLHWWNDADSGKEKYPEKKNAQGHFSSFFTNTPLISYFCHSTSTSYLYWKRWRKRI